jgi:hypothetical protein
MPLPNFTLAGDMCMGSVRVKIPQNASVKEAALKALFDSAFNNHRNLIGKKGVAFPTYVKKHKGQVPINSLRPSKVSWLK